MVLHNKLNLQVTFGTEVIPWVVRNAGNKWILAWRARMLNTNATLTFTSVVRLNADTYARVVTLLARYEKLSNE